MNNQIPRRNQVDKMTPAELAIREAMLEVEKAGANPKLTEAIVLLSKAQNSVADFVDEPLKITARVQTYEDACAVLEEQPINEQEMKLAGFTDDEIIYRKIKTITRALNEGWLPDWNNSNQKKYYPWFDLSSGGFVFDGTYYGYSHADAGYASRLCFPTLELAEYAGKQFTELYKGFILIQ